MSEHAVPTAVTNGTTVRLDSRGRINLVPFGPQSDTFIVSVSTTGTITLEPATVIPVHQHRILVAQHAPKAGAVSATVHAITDGSDTVSKEGVIG